MARKAGSTGPGAVVGGVDRVGHLDHVERTVDARAVANPQLGSAGAEAWHGARERHGQGVTRLEVIDSLAEGTPDVLGEGPKSVSRTGMKVRGLQRLSQCHIRDMFARSSDDDSGSVSLLRLGGQMENREVEVFSIERLIRAPRRLRSNPSRWRARASRPADSERGGTRTPTTSRQHRG